MQPQSRDGLARHAWRPCPQPDSGRPGRSAPGLTDYASSVERMKHLAGEIRHQRASEQVWLVEHPPVYTAGTSADAADLIDPLRFPGSPDRPRRPVHLSWPRPTGRLRDARPETAHPGCARLCGRAGTMDHRHACPVQCRWRTPRRSRRRLGQTTGKRQGCRRQDRRHRHTGSAAG